MTVSFIDLDSSCNFSFVSTMAIVVCQLLYLPLSPTPLSSSSSCLRPLRRHISLLLPPSLFRQSRNQISTYSSNTSTPLMEEHHDQNDARSKFLDLPFVSEPHKKLMVDLHSMIEERFQLELLPCTLPPDVQFCHSPNGTSQASLQIFPGHSKSSIDLVLESWIHSKLPNGKALNITSISTYLKCSTDAPNLFLDLIRGSPTNLVFVMDLAPRKDLILWGDYLQTFYEETQLDIHRQALEKIPEVRPYISPSLYIRSMLSPTAIAVTIDTEAGGVERMEEIIANHLNPVSKEVLRIWLDHCACVEREIGETERALLKKRDGMMRSKTVDIDLGMSFPRLFGPEVASRLLESIRNSFNV